MAIPNHPGLDRRTAPRLKVHLGCQLTVERIKHEAFIKDISPTGALLLSSFMPPPDADVLIKIETHLIRIPIVLEGKVVRRDSINTEQGPVGVFAVKFSRNSPALMLLVNKIVNPQIV
ncbi:MAG: PilZ domain-containing protein [Acidobacteriia bacterium]|nr:PilZ domain-containing protein [Terriglobia bacterium]